MKTLILGLLLSLACFSGAGWAGPLHEAAIRGDLNGLRGLSPATLNQPDDRGLTPLVLAIQHQQLAFAEALLKQGANPNGGDWPALHEAALNGDLAATRLLLSSGANPNLREKSNQGTPLHIACFHGHQAICSELLKAGAKVNLRDGEGLTPLFQAKDQGHMQLVDLLKAAGGR